MGTKAKVVILAAVIGIFSSGCAGTLRLGTLQSVVVTNSSQKCSGELLRNGRHYIGMVPGQTDDVLFVGPVNMILTFKAYKRGPNGESVFIGMTSSTFYLNQYAFYKQEWNIPPVSECY